MSAISIQGIKKYFGKVKAVDGVSFEVQRGEIFGFLGPNGAGKTTTIRCLMDFIRPDAGKITVLGKNAQGDSVYLKRKMGYLASEPRLYDEWTGREHISFAEGIRGEKNTTPRLVEQLGANISAKVKNLSTGNKRKISLVLALMSEPDVVVMDEPTAGLDPLLKNTMYEILSQMSRAGKTILMSSHDLSEVERICSRAAIIRSGKLVAVEDIARLHKKRLYRVWVALDGDKKVMDLTKIKGVELKSETPKEATFYVAGDIGPVVKFLAKVQPRDVSLEHAGLEEMFMKFYQRGK